PGTHQRRLRGPDRHQPSRAVHPDHPAHAAHHRPRGDRLLGDAQARPHRPRRPQRREPALRRVPDLLRHQARQPPAHLPAPPAPAYTPGGGGSPPRARPPGPTRRTVAPHVPGPKGLGLKILAAFAQDAEHGALPTLYAATANLPGGGYAGPDGPGERRGYPAL